MAENHQHVLFVDEHQIASQPNDRKRKALAAFSLALLGVACITAIVFLQVCSVHEDHGILMK
jgi:hypothetical protein